MTGLHRFLTDAAAELAAHADEAERLAAATPEEIARARTGAEVLHALVAEHDDMLGACARCRTAAGMVVRSPCPTLRWVGLPMADRPAYDEAWLPEATV